MESKTLFSLLSLLLVWAIAHVASSSEHQDFVPRPLLSTTHMPPDSTALPWSQTLTDSESESDSSESLIVRLEHRDSLASNATPSELLAHRLGRDSHRFDYIVSRIARSPHPRIAPRNATAGRNFSSPVVSGLSQGSGEYFTRVGVGTPARAMYMVVDTGSDVVWIQCSPCRRCYSQSDPVFDPRSSSSFAGVPCSSPICRRLDVSGCNQRRSCLYQVSYGDGSFTVGDFSVERLSFRRSSVGRVALGCGHDNEGLFAGAAGLLGLGRGSLSFPSQTGRVFGRRFAYCLADRQSGSTVNSTLIFGNAALPKTGAVFTPMVANPKMDTFYYVHLVGISVGGKAVPIRAEEFQIASDGSGGVIVDSGTSVTRLAQPAYVALRDAFRSGTTHLRRTDSGYSLFDTCYDLSGQNVVRVPTVVLRFGEDADLPLPASNYLIPVNTSGLFCFAFAGTSSGLSIIGNIQQQGIRVVLDAVGSRVGFVPHAC